MNERKRLLYLVLSMLAVLLITAGTSIFLLYRTAFKEQESRLRDTVVSRARLIEAITRHAKEHITAATDSFAAGYRGRYVSATRRDRILPTLPTIRPMEEI